MATSYKCYTAIKGKIILGYMSGNGSNIFFLNIFAIHSKCLCLPQSKKKEKEKHIKPTQLHKMWSVNNSKIKLYFSN